MDSFEMRVLNPFSTGFNKIRSISNWVNINDPMNKNFYCGPKFYRASLESNSKVSCSKSVKKSYGTKPPSTIKLFINAIRGIGKSLGVELKIRFVKIVLTLIFSPKNLSLRILSRIIPLFKGTKSMFSSFCFMMVNTGVLTTLISQPLRTSL